jgi:TniQ
VVLRPQRGEVLYSWLARIAALYRMSLADLLGTSATPWELCMAPGDLLLAQIAEMTRLPARQLHGLTLSGSGLAEKPCWWSMRQILPDRCFPHLAHEYQPIVCFCWACLRDDSKLGRPEYVRCSWLLAASTVCPQHRVPLQDACSHCGSLRPPIALQLGTTSRLACPACLRRFSLCPENRMLLPASFVSLLEFEQQLLGLLRRKCGYYALLQLVEDLLWLLTRPLDHGKLAVHALPDTAFRLPRHLHRLPRAKPWLGDFAVEVRRGLLTHLACLVQGPRVRAGLLPEPARDYSLGRLLDVVTEGEREEFKEKARQWPTNQWQPALDAAFY